MKLVLVGRNFLDYEQNRLEGRRQNLLSPQLLLEARPHVLEPKFLIWKRRADRWLLKKPSLRGKYTRNFFFYLWNRWQDIFESGAVELRLLSRIFHVDDIQELESVHGRVATYIKMGVCFRANAIRKQLASSAQK